MEIGSKIEPILSIADESFNAEHSKRYSLVLQLAREGITFAVCDIRNRKFVLLQNYSVPLPADALKASLLLDELKRGSEVLQCSFASVHASVQSENSMLVPHAVFDKENSKELLEFNNQVSEDDMVRHDHLQVLDANVLYAAPSVFISALERNFSTLSILHSSTSMLHTLFSMYKNSISKTVVLNIHQSRVEIFVLGQNKMWFCNSFRYYTTEDFIYFVLFAFEQLELSTESTNLYLYGEVEKRSAMFSILNKYVRNVRTGMRPEGFEYSHEFEKIPAHFYFSIFSRYAFDANIK